MELQTRPKRFTAKCQWYRSFSRFFVIVVILIYKKSVMENKAQKIRESVFHIGECFRDMCSTCTFTVMWSFIPSFFNLFETSAGTRVQPEKRSLSSFFSSSSLWFTIIALFYNINQTMKIILQPFLPFFVGIKPRYSFHVHSNFIQIVMFILQDRRVHPLYFQCKQHNNRSTITTCNEICWKMVFGTFFHCYYWKIWCNHFNVKVNICMCQANKTLTTVFQKFAMTWITDKFT